MEPKASCSSLPGLAVRKEHLGCYSLRSLPMLNPYLLCLFRNLITPGPPVQQGDSHPGTQTIPLQHIIIVRKNQKLWLVTHSFIHSLSHAPRLSAYLCSFQNEYIQFGPDHEKESLTILVLPGQWLCGVWASHNHNILGFCVLPDTKPGLHLGIYEIPSTGGQREKGTATKNRGGHDNELIRLMSSQCSPQTNCCGGKTALLQTFYAVKAGLQFHQCEKLGDAYCKSLS